MTRFTHIAVHEFTRAMFHVTQLGHFELDMKTMVTVKEMLQMEATLVASSCGMDYVTYLRDVFLPSIGCPVDAGGCIQSKWPPATGRRSKRRS
ncbi:hypothetical protein PsorP6_002813 [Peronosclerospora sorghi]|uniref:Uncharacterized protein n=1 Tax=Peronosclerospora sorghi TaxID=230839 RepID=A0ACC0VKF0_9STRA|nr:hypothetical protein PsorP6_002813 [Peronosclerospora sorghi]